MSTDTEFTVIWPSTTFDLRMAGSEMFEVSRLTVERHSHMSKLCFIFRHCWNQGSKTFKRHDFKT